MTNHFQFVSDSFKDKAEDDEEYRDVVKETEEIAEAYKDVEEEELPKATEQEQTDYEKYTVEYERQQKVIDSYEGLMKKKEQEEMLKRMKEYLKTIKVRQGRLGAQGKRAMDRLGKTSQFYKDVWQAVKSESPAFLNADKEKQCRLLELLAAPASEETDHKIIMGKLREEFPEILEWS